MIVKYKFIQDYSAVGTNVVAALAGMSNVSLNKTFKKDEEVNGTPSGTFVYVTTNGGTKVGGGGEYTGSSEYKIPANMLVYANPTTAGSSADDIAALYDVRNYPATYILSGLGTIAGLGYAFSKQKKFWGYVGFMILGSLVFGTAGRIIDYGINKTKNK